MRNIIFLCLLFSLSSCHFSESSDCSLPDNFLNRMYQLDDSDTILFFGNDAAFYALFGDRELHETPEEVWIKIGYDYNGGDRTLNVYAYDNYTDICRIADEWYLVISASGRLQTWKDLGPNTQIDGEDDPDSAL